MNAPVKITRYPRSEFEELMTGFGGRTRTQLLKAQIPLSGCSSYVNASVTGRSREKVPDCHNCGACCAFPQVVTVSCGDEDRLTEYWDVTVGDAVIERVIGRDVDTGYCAHFEGVPGKHSSCSIYENRPTTCRLFEAGSDRCLEFRRMYGIDAQLSEKELASDLLKLRKAPRGYITDATIDVVESCAIMTVNVEIDQIGETQHEIHRYDASKEEWHESEFLGLTINEAHQMIAEKSLQGVSK